MIHYPIQSYNLPRTMNYSEAKAEINETGLYYSADFYRMRKSDTIKLQLRDSATDILKDVIHNGKAETKYLLTHAINSGYVVKTASSNPDEYVISQAGHAESPFFERHVAMQIAYPYLYWSYFRNEQVWSPFDEKMQKLIALCESENKPKPIEKNISPKLSNSNYIDDLDSYKAELSRLYQNYIYQCRTKKAVEIKVADEFGPQIKALRDQVTQLIQERDARLKIAKDTVHNAKLDHSEFKKTKPNKKDYDL